MTPPSHPLTIPGGVENPQTQQGEAEGVEHGGSVSVKDSREAEFILFFPVSVNPLLPLQDL